MAAVIPGRAGDVDRRLDRLFRREVAPRLGQLEDQREAARRRAIQALGLMAVAIVATVVLVGPGHFGFMVLGIVGALVIGLGVVGQAQKRYLDAVRTTVMPAICEAIGDLAHTAGVAPDLDFDALEAIGLLPRHNRRRIDDVFTGRHRDVGFIMTEVKLHQHRRAGRNRRRRVFKGLIIAVETPHEIPARILIARDSGWIGNQLKGWIKGLGGMQRVPLPHAGFESAFAVYADRPEAAPEIVSPAFCDNLVAITEAHAGAPLQGAFMGRRFYLAIKKRGDQFRLGSLFRSARSLDEDAARVLHDVQTAHRLIEFLHGDRPDVL